MRKRSTFNAHSIEDDALSINEEHITMNMKKILHNNDSNFSGHSSKIISHYNNKKFNNLIEVNSCRTAYAPYKNSIDSFKSSDLPKRKSDANFRTQCLNLNKNYGSVTGLTGGINLAKKHSQMISRFGNPGPLIDATSRRSFQSYNNMDSFSSIYSFSRRSIVNLGGKGNTGRGEVIPTFDDIKKEI